MSITAGQIFKKEIYLDNESTGEPIGSDLVSDIDLRLFADRSKQIGQYNTASGITKQSDGRFIITIPETDTIKLRPFVDDNAYLEGYLLPCKEPIIIEIGKILDNKAND